MPIIPITYLEHICVQTFYSLDRTFIMSVISNSDAVMFSSLNQPWAGARWDGGHNALTGLGNGVNMLHHSNHKVNHFQPKHINWEHGKISFLFGFPLKANTETKVQVQVIYLEGNLRKH